MESTPSVLDFLGTVGSLVVGAAALWVALDVGRKTTQHVVRVVSVSATENQSRLHPGTYYAFELLVKNLGLAFPEMSISLSFQEKDGLGRQSMPMRAMSMRDRPSTDSAASVATGLMITFGWRSFEMSQDDIRFLQSLEDIEKQRARIAVYCAGYLVKVIHLNPRRDHISECWQNAVSRLGGVLGLGWRAKDQRTWKARVELPHRHTLSRSLSFFIHCLGKCERS